MIDFHAHILPGIDDGAVTLDDSIAMARALVNFGYKTVCCTPHCIKGYYDLTPKKVRDATLLLQADLDNADIRLELWPGMEYMLDEYFASYANDLQPLGKTRLLLCEAPPQAHPGVVTENLKLILEKGYVPLIAHPERTQYFYEILRSRGPKRDTCDEKNHDIGCGTWNEKSFESLNPESAEHGMSLSGKFLKKLWPFVSRSSLTATQKIPKEGHVIPDGCLFQANIGSFTGFYGEKVQLQAYTLLKMGCYTALASDLHDCGYAPKVLSHDKIQFNPYLKKLSEFDGSLKTLYKILINDVQKGQQGELF